ncbi:DUF5825 family protein [Micromonospora rubida]|uniref:DUF5825 family protein n=1 Tax=Micromonospora rubida TaxID=2697657 RepID=A0ABW7SSW7_9ACTN
MTASAALPAEWTVPAGHAVTGTLAAHSRLGIGGTIRIGNDENALPALALLREASALAADVGWTAVVDGPVPIWQLTHLPPPRDVSGVAPGDLARWRETFRFGLCYYRRGPGFLTVHDARRGVPTRSTIADPAAIAAVEALRTPRRVADLDPVLRDAVAGLAGRGLVLHIGRSAMTLPWRPTRWPVPCIL